MNSKNSQLNDVYDSMMQRLGIPIDSSKSTPIQVLKVVWMAEALPLIDAGIVLLGVEDIIEMLRTYADILELVNKLGKEKR